MNYTSRLLYKFFTLKNATIHGSSTGTMIFEANNIRFENVGYLCMEEALEEAYFAIRAKIESEELLRNEK